MTRIHVNRIKIAADKKAGTFNKVFGVETTGMRKRYGRSVTVQGTVKFIYRPRRPLSCGAVAWAETMSSVVVHRSA